MNFDRRSFMKAALAAGAFPYLSGCCGSLCAGRRSFGPGDKVRLACVGLGQQAWNDIQEFEKTGLVEIAALCDTDLEGKQCVEAIKKYPKAPRFTDFRKMLDATDGMIDAVAVMTPDHSHFPALMAAMKRGLPVFSEKPLAHTFEECELLMAAAKKYGVATQMGNQGHSGENYYQFKHYVDNARLDVVLELVVVFAGVALVAHLRRDIVFGRRLHEKLAFLERVGEGLFGEDGKPALHRRHQRREVRVVGRHHRDGVDLAVHGVKHLAEVGEALRIGILLESGAALTAAEVGVAQGDDGAKARLLEFLDVVPRLVAYADAREADLAVTEALGER